MIVVDASSILEILLNTPAAEAISNRIFARGQMLNAPHLIDVKVMQVLRRYGRTNTLSAGRAQEALDDYRELPITRYPHEMLLPRMRHLRHNLTAYDAAYVSLAEALDAPLVTCDKAVAAIAGHGAKILLFDN